jgi:hypothetical protein
VFPAEPEVSLADLKRFPPPKVAMLGLSEGKALRWLVFAELRDVGIRMGDLEAAAKRIGKPPHDLPEYRALIPIHKTLRHELQERDRYADAWQMLARALGLIDQGNDVKARPAVRLRSLRTLRELLGPDAYRKGQMLPLPAGP